MSASASLPINATNRSQNENQVFIGMFRPDGGGKPRWYGNLKHYTVQIERHGPKLEVIFVPEEPPLKPNEAGTGGSTIYGWEVHYIIALDRMKILEEQYAR